MPGYPGLWCVPLDDELADRLIERTHDGADANLHHMTSDLTRFSSRERLARWRGDREMVCLVDSERSLLGVIWVGEKRMPEREDYFDPELIRRRAPRLTWAIRLYGTVRGHGLAFTFSEHAFDVLAGHEGRFSLWFQTKAANSAARNLGWRMGFSEVSGEADGTVVGIRIAD